MFEFRTIISSSRLEIELLPDQGARLARITYKDEGGPIDITPSDPTGFHMVPYSNRIRNGKFNFNGVEYFLGNSEKHSIHGVARNLPWVVIEQEKSQITCEFISIPQFDSKSRIFTNYPFSFRACVAYRLQDARLEQTLTVENTDKSPMPVGGGFHPYFRTSLRANERIEVRAGVSGEYPIEANVPLPTGPLRPVPPELDFSLLKPLPVGLDNCFGGWNGKLLMYWPISKIAAQFEASNTLTHLVLYSPQGKNFCAIEPVANMTNGINFMDDSRYNTGMRILKPGQIFCMSYSTEIFAHVDSDELKSFG